VAKEAILAQIYGKHVKLNEKKEILIEKLNYRFKKSLHEAAILKLLKD
jgi:hypothetical protein